MSNLFTSFAILEKTYKIKTGSFTDDPNDLVKEKAFVKEGNLWTSKTLDTAPFTLTVTKDSYTLDSMLKAVEKPEEGESKQETNRLSGAKKVVQKPEPAVIATGTFGIEGETSGFKRTCSKDVCKNDSFQNFSNSGTKDTLFDISNKFVVAKYQGRGQEIVKEYDLKGTSCSLQKETITESSDKQFPFKPDIRC